MKKYEEHFKKLLPIIKKYGNNISFLGMGKEGSAWGIDNEFVIKIHQFPIFWLDFPQKEMEPKIYEFGSIDNAFWVIREYFITPEKKDLSFFEQIIFEAICSSDFNLKNFSSNKVLEEKYSLKTNWIQELFLEIEYKTITSRDMDLHAENLGFTISERRPIFFDW